MRLRTLSPLLALALAVPATAAQAQEFRRGEVRRIPDSYPYRMERIEMPAGLLAENGGISFLPDGRLVAVFHHGEVMFYDPPTKKWSLFATGLHDPLGVVAISDREVIVGQRPEITRIRDTDGDGKGDLFETLSDDFGMSGNYSEFTHGPILDADGNLYFSLNTASNNGPVRPIIRGEYSPRGRIGRMFSAVPYRGWVMKITPDGKTIPFASGFRSPNGLALDREGNLYVTDNQGDWLGTSKLFLVQPGGWHGHLPSLAWEPGITENPFTIPLPVLDRMRVKEIIQIPQSILANSPTEPAIDYTAGKFGPFAGQMFIGELNHPTLMRVMLEEVNHQMQGAVAPFLNGDPLRHGGNRLTFAPDGSLWMGHTDHGWGGDAGITRITWTGQMPLDVYTMSLTPTGFDLTFTKPVDRALAANPEAYKFSRYYYDYSINYGSPQRDKTEVKVTEARVSADGKRVSLTLAELKPGYVHQVDLPTIKAADGSEMVNSTVYYTLNQLRQGGPAAPAASSATR